MNQYHLKAFPMIRKVFVSKFENVMVRGNFFLSLYGLRAFFIGFLVRNPKKFGRVVQKYTT
jgi:hypothetical protein